MSMHARFEKGAITRIELQRPTSVNLNDCRKRADSCDGFVSFNFSDGEHEVSVFLPARQVGALFADLAKLYVPEKGE